MTEYIVKMAHPIPENKNRNVVDRIHELGPQSGLDATPIIGMDKWLKKVEIALK